jgi:ABC-type bacteriocin/lantibiotic exporter with double-glycine peptidase domain
MIIEYRKIFNILNRNQRKKIIILSILNYITLVMETLSLALVVPIILSVLSPKLLQDLIGGLNIEMLKEVKIALDPIYPVIVFISAFILAGIYKITITAITIKILNSIRVEVATRIYTNITATNKWVNEPRSYAYYANVFTKQVDLFNAFGVSEIITINCSILYLVSVSIGLIYILSELTILVIILILPIIWLHKKFANKRIKKYAKERAVRDLEYQEALKDTFTLLKEIYTFNAFNFFSKRVEAAHHRLLHAIARQSFVRKAIKPLTEIYLVLVIFIVVAIASIDISATSTIASALIIVFMGAVKVMPSLNTVLQSAYNLSFIRDIIDDFKGMLNTNAGSEREKVNCEALIRISAVEISVNEGRKITVEDIEIDKGELVLIKGPSGCGKTTLLEVIMGLRSATSGQVIVNGQTVIYEKNCKNTIAYVPQNPLLAGVSVVENIAFGVPKDSIDIDRVLDVTKKVGLIYLIEQEGSMYWRFEPGAELTLSGGERQRIAIARALYHQPEIILLDEITSSLDPRATEEMYLLITKLNLLGATLILVSHESNIAVKFDKTIEFIEGRVVYTKHK